MAAAAVIRPPWVHTPAPSATKHTTITNIICDGSTLLKLEKKLLLVILVLMHVTSVDEL